MSNYERNKGKLIPTNKSIDDLFKEFGGTEYDLDIYTKEEYVREYCHDYGYQFVNGKIYEVKFEVKGDRDCQDFADVSVDKNGIISFHTYHYNGGAHYTEVIESELRKMLK